MPKSAETCSKEAMNRFHLVWCLKGWLDKFNLALCTVYAILLLCATVKIISWG